MVLKKESIQWIWILFLNCKMNQESTIRENSRIVPTLILTYHLFQVTKIYFAHAPSQNFAGPSKNGGGTARKMMGSPRALENAVPTAKNPHGVWVWCRCHSFPTSISEWEYAPPLTRSGRRNLWLRTKIYFEKLTTTIRVFLCLVKLPSSEHIL